MCWAIKEGISKERKQVPCGRLLSEIFHQGKLLETLRRFKQASDSCFTVTTSDLILNSKSLYAMKIINKPPVDEKWIELTTTKSEPLKNFPSILQENNLEVLASLVATHARELGVNTESVVAAPDVTKGKRGRTEAESDAAKDKGKRQKVGASSIPKKRRGKEERVITKEHLDEVLEAIEKEELKPKKKKAPLHMVCPMFELTPAMKKMADEQAIDFKANKQELKAQYVQQRDEKLKALGLENCDEVYKSKITEVREMAGKVAEDDADEEMMIVVEKAPEAEASEAVQVAQGENQGTTKADALGSA
jgi:hypothetical protein